jgi:hypothetical protein
MSYKYETAPRSPKRTFSRSQNDVKNILQIVLRRQPRPKKTFSRTFKRQKNVLYVSYKQDRPGGPFLRSYNHTTGTLTGALPPRWLSHPHCHWRAATSGHSDITATATPQPLSLAHNSHSVSATSSGTRALSLSLARCHSLNKATQPLSLARRCHEWPCSHCRCHHSATLTVALLA